LCTPLTSLAYEQGDVIVRAGATQVQANNDYDPDGVSANSNTQLGINIVYMATDNIGVELLAASPFKHDIKHKALGVIGSTKQLPPTLSVQYYMNNSSIITPYVGAGLNYTVFFDENLDALGIDNIELKDSAGLSLQAGVDIALNDNWGLNIDIRQIDIDTEVESSSGAADGLDVYIDPLVYSFTALYKF
jgi:outer membrane protein